MNILFLPAAINDIRNIENYIENTLNNPLAAVNTKNSIINGIERLQDQPKLGKIFNEYYRYIIIKNYLIFYTIKENGIHIIRVLDGRTDYQFLLYN